MEVSTNRYLALLVTCAVIILSVQAIYPPAEDVCWRHVCPPGQVCKVMPPTCFGALCTPICVKHPTVSHPGSCPKPIPGLAGICIVKCQSDADCAIGQKCCGSCPRECTNVGTGIVLVKPGRCPMDFYLSSFQSGRKARRCRRLSCKFDGDCPGDLKCCTVDRCGRMCVRPQSIYSAKVK